MSKVIAIIDKPKNCGVCTFGICKYSLLLSTYRKGYYCQLKEPQDRVVEDFDFEAEVHLSNCPLKEVPQKKEEIEMEISHAESVEMGYREGYNACINEIMRGAE